MSRIGKIYFDPEAELDDGRGWVVEDDHQIALRFATPEYAIERAFEVHPGLIGFLVDLYGLMGGIMFKVDDDARGIHGAMLELELLPSGIPPLRDVIFDEIDPDD